MKGTRLRLEKYNIILEYDDKQAIVDWIQDAFTHKEVPLTNEVAFLITKWAGFDSIFQVKAGRCEK